MERYCYEELEHKNEQRKNVKIKYPYVLRKRTLKASLIHLMKLPYAIIHIFLNFVFKFLKYFKFIWRWANSKLLKSLNLSLSIIKEVFSFAVAGFGFFVYSFCLFCVLFVFFVFAFCSFLVITLLLFVFLFCYPFSFLPSLF